MNEVPIYAEKFPLKRKNRKKENLSMCPSFPLCYAICVSVWYEKRQFLGLKLLNFCHFCCFNNHETDCKAIKTAKETSAATLRPKKHKNKKLLVSTKIPLCY